MRLRKARSQDDDLEVAKGSTGSKGALQWKCPACGAYNDDSDQKCTECTALRADAPAIPKMPDITTSDWETPSSKPDEPEELDQEKDEDEVEAKEPEEDEEELNAESPADPPVITGPLSSISTSQPSTPSTPTPPSFSTPSSFTTTLPAASTGGTHYYLIFVNSPAPSLIKSKVSVDFEDFEVVTIGRNPENVIVVPDPEVSRKHAELTMQGSRLMLRDVGSKNGTYLFNGKQFEQVSDSVEVKPNSLIKFGTGTIVRLTSE